MPFALEIHWPRDATEWAAWGAIALVVVTAVYVLETRRTVAQLRAGTEDTIRGMRESTERTVAELREARFAEFLPMPRWQSPTAAVKWYGEGANKKWECELVVLLTNEGPGPARIYKRSVSTDTREMFEILEVDEPSTMPPGNRITLQISTGHRDVFERGHRIFTIMVTYGDLLGEFEYETIAVVDAYFDDQGHHSARFVDSDERSALERRLERRSPPAPQ